MSRTMSVDALPQETRHAMRHVASALARNETEILRRWFDNQFEPTRLRRYRVEGTDLVDRALLKQSFVRPLLGLLIEYMRTSDPVYHQLYLYERHRYAPHRADPTLRREFFSEVVAADEQVLLDYVGPSPAVRMRFQEWLHDLHRSLVSETDSSVVRILTVGDCLMGDIRVFLPSVCQEFGVTLDVRSIYFSALQGRDLSVTNILELLDTTPIDLVALSFLTYEGLPIYKALLSDASQLDTKELDSRVDGLVGVMRRFLERVREKTDAPFLLHNASGLPLTSVRMRLPVLPAISSLRRRVLERLNEAVGTLAANTPNCILIDEAAVARAYGHRPCSREIAPRRIGRDAFFHTSWFGSYLSPLYADVVRAYRDLKSAKVLLIDLDNTLWEGVMADGAVRQHRDRQRLLRKLRNSGMLLVVVSKNESKNIRWEEMELTVNDFTLSKISWNPKVQSIQEVASELDLGLDSFVLIDDSPEEREFVRLQFPQVVTMDPEDPYTWKALERLLEFPNTRQTAEGRSRTEMYRARAKRREAVKGSVDFPAMMAALQLQVGFGPMKQEDLDRVTELFQRTNQFNTTTIRYQRKELAQLLDSPTHAVYVAELSDKFGSFGIVVVVIVARKDTAAILDSFVMSCRAMGFGLERLVLGKVLEQEKQAKTFFGRFLPTERNGPASGLYSEAGFVATTDTDWQLTGDAPRPATPDWFSVYDRAGGRDAGGQQ